MGRSGRVAVETMRLVLRGVWLGVLALGVAGVRAQTTAGPAAAAHDLQGATQPASTIRANSTLVVAPALVRSAAGELVHGLTAKDFRVLDDGVAQSVAVEEQTSRQPIAMVVLLQTGCGASRQFANYAGMGAMLDAMVAGVAHRVSVVTFDSQPEEAWDFTPDVGELRDAFAHPVEGDNGAAVLDAVSYGIGLLKEQPAEARRVILLVSQPQDDGSEAKAEDVVRRLGENDVSILSVTFSPEAQWLKDQFTKERHGNKPYKYGADGPTLSYTFNLDGPLRVALKAMRTNAAASVATMSGGEAVRFGNKNELERQMGALANDLANEYVLSFQPSAKAAGFHSLTVQVPGVAGATVAARTSYWAAGEGEPGGMDAGVKRSGASGPSRMH